MPAVVVPEYEIYRNEKNALMFLFYHQKELDANSKDGPFYFTIEGNSIHAGTKANHVVFNNVNQAVVDIARERGNLVLMEFEDRDPVRATPCYITDSF